MAVCSNEKDVTKCVLLWRKKTKHKNFNSYKSGFIPLHVFINCMQIALTCKEGGSPVPLVSVFICVLVTCSVIFKAQGLCILHCLNLSSFCNSLGNYVYCSELWLLILDFLDWT